jgi:prevent-host-death family protein
VLIFAKLANLEKIAMNETKTIPSTDAQNNFGQILNDVVQNNTRYVIKRRTIPLAIVLSLSDFEQIMASQDERQKMTHVVQELGHVYSLGETIQAKVENA